MKILLILILLLLVLYLFLVAPRMVGRADRSAMLEHRFYAHRGLFDNESEADMVVDLLNNVIGRRIGANHRYLSRKQIALLALKELRENGLYRYEYCSDGLWRVMKVRISDDVYNDMYNTFMNLDNDGK